MRVRRQRLGERRLREHPLRLVELGALDVGEDQEAVDVREPGQHAVAEREVEPLAQVVERAVDVAAHREVAAAEGEHRREPRRVAAAHGVVVGAVVDRDRLVEQAGGDQREAGVVERRDGRRLERARLERAPRELDRAARGRARGAAPASPPSRA